MNDPENTSIKQVWQRIHRPVEFPASPYSLPKATLESLQDIPEGEARWLDCNGVNIEALEASTNGVWTISNQIKNTIYGPPIPGAMLAFHSHSLPKSIRYPEFTPEWSAACDRAKQRRMELIRLGEFHPDPGIGGDIDLIAARHDLALAGEFQSAIKVVDMSLARECKDPERVNGLLDERLALMAQLGPSHPTGDTPISEP